MADVRLICVLLVAWTMAPDKRRRCFFFRFEKAERPIGGPMDRPGPALPKRSYSLLFLAY